MKISVHIYIHCIYIYTHAIHKSSPKKKHVLGESPPPLPPCFWRLAEGLVVLLRLALRGGGLDFHRLGVRDELLQHQHHLGTAGAPWWMLGVTLLVTENDLCIYIYTLRDLFITCLFIFIFIFIFICTIIFIFVYISSYLLYVFIFIYASIYLFLIYLSIIYLCVYIFMHVFWFIHSTFMCVCVIFLWNNGDLQQRC